MTNKICFSFWNCSLAPTAGTQAPLDSDIEEVLVVISKLIEEREIDILALCEVNEHCFNKITTALERVGFIGKLINTKTETGSKFDLAFFYKKNKLSISEEKSQTSFHGSSILKVSHLISILTLEDHPIDFFISHWSSRLMGIGQELREESATQLRRFTEERIKDRQIILIGDYNDEPHSRSILNNIKATNDRSCVIKNPNYWFYNPFWKELTPRHSFKKNQHRHESGTHFSDAGNRNTWFTFDQAFFSGNFLTDGTYLLNEEKTGAFVEETLINLIKSRKSIFDHTPIIGTIEHKDN